MTQDWTECRETKVLPDPRDQGENPERTGDRGCREHRELPDLWDQSVQSDNPDPPALPDPLDPRLM